MKQETAKMKTQLSQIETAAELVNLVSWQGVSTKQDDICRMQDIIGNSTIEELDRLANFTGDKSGKPGTQKYFYQILSVIWRWDDLIEFWNKHTNPEHKEMKELKEELQRHKTWKQQDAARIKELNGQLEEAAKQWSEEFQKKCQLEDQLKARNQEIIELKAKLYDLMTKENGAA